MTDAGKKLKITDPLRVRNIVNKFCTAQMQCLIRIKDNQTMGIRATFGQRPIVDDSPYIDLTGMSPVGFHRLKEGAIVVVEVIGSQALVVFLSQVRRKVNDIISIDIPGIIMNVERRANLRCKTGSQNMAFAQLSSWHPVDEDMAAPPAIPPFENLRSWQMIADFSIGGLCLTTRFPSIFNALENGMSDDKVAIWLPRSAPFVMQMGVRWKKVVREKVDLPHGDTSMMNNVRTLSDFRIGFQFKDPAEEHLFKIRQFMRRLVHAEAI